MTNWRIPLLCLGIGVLCGVFAVSVVSQFSSSAPGSAASSSLYRPGNELDETHEKLDRVAEQLHGVSTTLSSLEKRLVGIDSKVRNGNSLDPIQVHSGLPETASDSGAAEIEELRRRALSTLESRIEERRAQISAALSRDDIQEYGRSSQRLRELNEARALARETDDVDRLKAMANTK